MNPTTLRTMFSEATAIQKLRNGDYAPIYGNNFAIAAQRFTLDEVAALHPRLPEVFAEEYAQLHPDHSEAMNARILKDTLTYWEKPVLAKLVMKHDLFGLQAYAVHSVVDIIPGHGPKQRTMIANLVWTVVTERGLRYARSITTEACLIEKEILDQRFKGWETRFTVAKSLDVAPRQIAEAMFTDIIPPAQVDMTGVTFE